MIVASLHSSTTMLPGKLDVGMANSIVSRKRIRAAKSLLLSTQIAPNLLLAAIVDRVLVPCKVVGSREDGVAGLACTRVDAVALVGPVLSIEELRRHAVSAMPHLHVCPASTCAKAMCLTMTLALVLLQERRRVESQAAAVVSASVCAAISGDPTLWPPRAVHVRADAAMCAV